MTSLPLKDFAKPVGFEGSEEQRSRRSQGRGVRKEKGGKCQTM